MDLKIGIIVMLLLGLWVVAIFGPVMFNIAMGISAWTWLSFTAWYSLRFKGTSAQETIPCMFKGWEWA